MAKNPVADWTPAPAGPDCSLGGTVCDPKVVNSDDSNGPGRSDDTPSLGSGAGVSPGPCA